MAKQNHGIVQDERGQDQPVSKKAAHRSEPTMPKDAYELDPRDVRDGVHDPSMTSASRNLIKPAEDYPPRGSLARADVQPDPDLSHPEPSLPEGLRRPRTVP
jgi:hypothetical protein